MATWSGNVDAVRIWATNESGYNAIGATNDCSSLALWGAASVGFPVSAAGAGAAVWYPYRICDEVMIRTKLSTTDRNFLVSFAIICLLQVDVIHRQLSFRPGKVPNAAECEGIPARAA